MVERHLRSPRLLKRSPEKGPAFEKVFQHFFEGGGIEKLAARAVNDAFAISRDGRTLFFRERDGVWSVPISAGDAVPGVTSFVSA